MSEVRCLRLWSASTGCIKKTASFAFYEPQYGKVLEKIRRLAYEEVILELVGSKCLLVLLYGLDFVITRVLMKLFKSANISLIFYHLW